MSISDSTETQSGEHRLPPEELSLAEALSLGVQLHRGGHVDEAESLYRRILQLAPDQADAMHFLGVLLHQRDRSDEAVDLIRRSIALEPGLPDRHNNLGNVLLERHHLADATEAYGQAIAFQPGHADAHNNLGAVLRAQGRLDEAAAAYRKAIELNPNHVDAHSNMGNLLSSQGRVKEAVAYFCTALTLTPNHPMARRLLGIAYYTLGQVEAAADVFRQWLSEEPDHPVANHLYAACSGRNVPARASDAYVESTFDLFADSFDAKLERLVYRAPQLVADALARASGTAGNRFVALDAGCGTGLCGSLIAPFVRRLIGVDLSSRMLAKAQGRGVYDELVKDELMAYMSRHPDSFDVIVSGDTLVYFGPLESVLSLAFRALRLDGLLVFTIEETPDGGLENGFRIHPHGRYSHGRLYVRQAMSAAGFVVLAVEAVHLRMEAGSPVSGLVVTGHKPR